MNFSSKTLKRITSTSLCMSIALSMKFGLFGCGKTDAFGGTTQKKIQKQGSTRQPYGRHTKNGNTGAYTCKDTDASILHTLRSET